MRRFHASDYGELAEWYRAHDQEPPAPDTLPAVGLIEPGVGCGFLWRTDSAVAIIEGFVTNPAAQSEARHRALEAITEGLIESARTAGYRHLLAILHNMALTERAKAHGFTHRTSCQMYGLEV